jgi:hypothetical protein
VDGQGYDYSRVHGRLTWVHVPDPSYLNVKISDPRALLHMLERLTRFQARGDQVIGGVRLTVLRAAGPGRLTRRALLPAVFTSGQPVASLDVWADQHGVVHRVAFTFRAAAAARIMGQQGGEQGRAAELPACGARAGTQGEAGARKPIQARTTPLRPGDDARLPGTAGGPGDYDHGDLLRDRPAAAHHRTQDAVSYRQFLRPASPR